MSIKEEIPVSVASVLAVRCEEEAVAEDNAVPLVSAMDFGPQALIGRRLNQRYILESVLGSGGTAWVFKARDLRKVEVCSAQPYVAIKILNVDLQNHPEARVGLEREAARAQQLSHPNIVGVYDFDRDGTLFYLVMEWLSGLTLDRYIQQLGVKERQSLHTRKLAEALISGLRFAHSQGVVHADFKPANVILDEKGLPRILDFGVARMAYATGYQQPGWSTGFNGYTPTYASVRRLKGVNPSKEDDTYALACVLYELLDGRHPYDRRTALEARQEKIKLKRPRGLTRMQWKALAQALDVNNTSPPDLDALHRAFARASQRAWPATLGLASAVVAITMAAAAVGPLSGLERWQSLLFRISGDFNQLEASVLEMTPARRQVLWTSVAPSLLAELERQIGQYRTSETVEDLDTGFRQAMRLATWGITDERLEAHIQWLDQQRVQELYRSYGALQQTLTTADFLDDARVEELKNGLLMVRALDERHPLLSHGLWQKSLNDRLQMLIQRKRWSDALVLAEVGKVLQPANELYQDLAKRLETMELTGSKNKSWPMFLPVQAERASSRMIVDLIRTGYREEAEQELRRSFQLVSGAEREVVIAGLKAAFDSETAALPMPLLYVAHAHGAKFFADLWQKTLMPDTLLGEAEHSARVLLETIERGNDFQPHVKRLGEQLNRMSADMRQIAEQHLSYRLRQHLSWYLDWPLLHERYRTVASKLFPREDWVKATAQEQMSCRDVTVSGGRLVNVCRDWLAPYVPGPELVLISDPDVRQSFYMGQREISVGDYNTYCRLSQECRVRRQPESLPLTEVSYYDAVRYARWLSRITGNSYRIPSYREWRVTAEQGEMEQSCQGEQSLTAAGDGTADGLGLMNMAANVREFVTLRQQIYVRGGDVRNRQAPCSIAVAQTHGGTPDLRTGFRLVRELETRS